MVHSRRTGRPDVRGLIKAVANGAGTPGLWAALVVVSVQRLLHGAFHEVPFAPYSAAEYLIRKSPGSLATYAIDHLGHRAMPAIGYMFITATLVLGYAIGRRPAWVLAGVAFILTSIAAYVDPLVHDISGTITSA